MRTGTRTVTWLPKFLGCIDNQIFLPMMLHCTLLACTRVPLMKSCNYSKYTIKAGLAQLVARVFYCRVGDHGFGSQGPTNAQGFTQKLRYHLSCPVNSYNAMWLPRMTVLSPLQGSLWVVGRPGREKKRAPAFSFFPLSPTLFLFSIIAIFIGIPSGSLWGGGSWPRKMAVLFPAGDVKTVSSISVLVLNTLTLK